MVSSYVLAVNILFIFQKYEYVIKYELTLTCEQMVYRTIKTSLYIFTMDNYKLS